MAQELGQSLFPLHARRKQGKLFDARGEQVLTIVKLSDVNGEPKVKLDLPGPLRIGDPVALCFRLERQNGGRFEVLEVNDRFRVSAVGFDASRTPHRQLLSVEPTERAPTWRSVKKRDSGGRRLGPTKFPKTDI